MSEDKMVQATSEPGTSDVRSPELRRFKREDSERTDWAVIGNDGAVHFWKFNKHEHMGGVEEHRKEPANYQEGSPPSHEQCFILGCPCWHDGSSLYADKFFPILEVQGEEAVYIQLEWEYRHRFESDGERKPECLGSADILNNSHPIEEKGE